MCFVKTKMSAQQNRSVKSVQGIAENAIQRINCLLLIEERAPARSGNHMTVPSPSSGTVTYSVSLKPSLTCSAVLTDSQSNQKSNTFEEFRRRFPTTSRRKGVSGR